MAELVVNATTLDFTTEGNLITATNLTLQNSTGTSYVWPTVDATNGQVLSSLADGTMSWTSVSASAEGITGSIQFNTGGALDGNNNFLYDIANNSVIIGSNNNTFTTVGPIPGFSTSIRNVEAVPTNDTNLEIISNLINQSAIYFRSDDISLFNVAIISFSPSTRTLNISATGLGPGNESTLNIDASTINITATNDITINAQTGTMLLDSEALQIRGNASGERYDWPTAAGTVGQLLSIGSAPGSIRNLEWVTNNITVAGIEGSIQFNTGGILDGNSQFLWDTANTRLLAAGVGSGTSVLTGTPADTFYFDLRDQTALQNTALIISGASQQKASILFNTDNDITVTPTIEFSGTVGNEVLSINGFTEADITIETGVNKDISLISARDIIIQGFSGIEYKWPTNTPLSSRNILGVDTNTEFGQLEWVSLAGGSTQQIQYNVSGGLEGSGNFIYDFSDDYMLIAGTGSNVISSFPTYFNADVQIGIFNNPTYTSNALLYIQCGGDEPITTTTGEAGIVFAVGTDPLVSEVGSIKAKKNSNNTYSELTLGCESRLYLEAKNDQIFFENDTLPITLIPLTLPNYNTWPGLLTNVQDHVSSTYAEMVWTDGQSQIPTGMHLGYQDIYNSANKGLRLFNDTTTADNVVINLSPYTPATDATTETQFRSSWQHSPPLSPDTFNNYSELYTRRNHTTESITTGIRLSYFDNDVNNPAQCISFECFDAPETGFSQIPNVTRLHLISDNASVAFGDLVTTARAGDNKLTYTRKDVMILSAGIGNDVQITGLNQLVQVVSNSEYKDNQQPLENTELIYQLEPKSYIWNDKTATPGEKDFGLIAEEVYKINPDYCVLSEDNITPRGVKYKQLCVPMITEMKKLRQRINDLEAQNASFEARLAALESV